jgi:hypothetical protein
MRLTSVKTKKKLQKESKPESIVDVEPAQTFAMLINEIREGKSVQLGGITLSIQGDNICFQTRRVPSSLDDSQIWKRIYGASERLAHELTRRFPEDAERFET